MVDGVGEEVGVEEDLVGRLEGGVVVEEHGGGDLGAGGAVSRFMKDEFQRGYTRTLRGSVLHLSLLSSSWFARRS